MTAPNPNSPAFDVLAYAEAIKGNPVQLLLQAAAMWYDEVYLDEDAALIRAVAGALSACRYVRADEQEALAAMEALEASAKEMLRELERIATDFGKGECDD